MATKQSREKRLERAQTRVIFTVPFFAPGVVKLPVTWDESIPTACTDGTGIRWSPEFFDSLPDPVLVTVLCHETCHCLLGHGWRAPEGVDWETWNVACDHAVNLMLKDFSAGVTSKGLADPFPFPEPADSYCADPKYAGMAEELIYRDLMNRPKSGQKQPGGKIGAGASGGSGGVQTPGKPGKSQGGGKAAQIQGTPSNTGKGSMPSFGQIAAPKSAVAKSVGNDWSNTLIQSAKLAQGQGTLPGGLERLVESTVHPQVPWWQILRSWLREQAADDWDFMHPAPEYDETGFVMPSLLSERCGPIVFATDTSGSIDQDMLAHFQAEKQSCLDEMRPRRLVDLYCDARLQAVHEYTPGETITKECPGGGGTDFRPVFEHVEQMSEPVKAVVYLTDLYGTFPSVEPGVPVIWVSWTKDKQAPFGTTVYAGGN